MCVQAEKKFGPNFFSDAVFVYYLFFIFSL